MAKCDFSKKSAKEFADLMHELMNDAEASEGPKVLPRPVHGGSQLNIRILYVQHILKA